jgi:SAM-dependent methyltransferase
MTGFPADLYAGTAEYYARYRPRYPDFMLQDLRVRVGVGGTLVDLACGPGQIAVPMAPHFDRVLAVDLEPDMIDVGREVAHQAGVTHINWQVGRAEELSIESGSVDLLTIGSAFHRLERELVAARVKEWLRPDGALVVMGYGRAPHSTEPKPPWQEIMSRVVEKWTGPPSEATRRALSGPLHGEVLESAGYTIEQDEWSVPRRWTLDELVGLTYSISISSKQQLGDRVDAFEAELRSELLGYDGSGTYDEQLSFFAVIASLR